MAIRHALGADRARLRNLILGESLVLAGIGTGIGLVVGLLVARFVRSLVFGVASVDPLTFFGAGAILILVALGASYLPVRRAIRAEPESRTTPGIGTTETRPTAFEPRSKRANVRELCLLRASLVHSSPFRSWPTWVCRRRVERLRPPPSGLASPRPAVSADEASRDAHQWLEEHDEQFLDLLHRLWGLPEPAHTEFRTASLVMSTLQDAGFEIEAGVADLSTAFVASWGQGRPRIGVVTLLDALDGLSQQAGSTERAAVVPDDGSAANSAGHGCGHHLISAADVSAVLAIRSSMERHELRGTVRLIGAPAEEIYHGGVYMVRAGAFD